MEKKTKRFIRPVVPWTSTEIPQKAVTWLWSHSVMEHVDDVEQAWKSCGTWLAPNGVMTHEIDYQSHRLTKHWNGHWSTSDLCWRIIRGYRPYLINRLPHSAQMAIVKSSGFEIASELVYTPPRPSLPADMLRPHFALTTTPQDRITGMAFVVLRARLPDEMELELICIPAGINPLTILPELAVPSASCSLSPGCCA